MQELTLDQMLDDPIVRQLMARDGVQEEEVRSLSVHVVRRRSGPAPAAPARLSPEPRSFVSDPSA